MSHKDYKPSISVQSVLTEQVLHSTAAPDTPHFRGLRALTSKFAPSKTGRHEGKVTVSKQVVSALKQVSAELDAAQRHYLAYKQYGDAGESLLKLSADIISLPGEGGAAAGQSSSPEPDQQLGRTSGDSVTSGQGAPVSPSRGVGQRRWGYFPMLQHLRVASGKQQRQQQHVAVPQAAVGVAGEVPTAASAAHDPAGDTELPPDSPKENWMALMRQKRADKEQAMAHMTRIKHAVLVIQRAWRACLQRRASRALAMLVLRQKVRRAHRAAYVSNLLRKRARPARRTTGASSTSGGMQDSAAGSQRPSHEDLGGPAEELVDAADEAAEGDGVDYLGNEEEAEFGEAAAFMEAALEAVGSEELEQVVLTQQQEAEFELQLQQVLQAAITGQAPQLVSVDLKHLAGLLPVVDTAVAAGAAAVAAAAATVPAGSNKPVLDISNNGEATAQQQHQQEQKEQQEEQEEQEEEEEQAPVWKVISTPKAGPRRLQIPSGPNWQGTLRTPGPGSCHHLQATTPSHRLCSPDSPSARHHHSSSRPSSSTRSSKSSPRVRPHSHRHLKAGTASRPGSSRAPEAAAGAGAAVGDACAGSSGHISKQDHHKTGAAVSFAVADGDSDFEEWEASEEFGGWRDRGGNARAAGGRAAAAGGVDTGGLSGCEGAAAPATAATARTPHGTKVPKKAQRLRRRLHASGSKSSHTKVAARGVAGAPAAAPRSSHAALTNTTPLSGTVGAGGAAADVPLPPCLISHPHSDAAVTEKAALAGPDDVAHTQGVISAANHADVPPEYWGSAAGGSYLVGEVETQQQLQQVPESLHAGLGPALHTHAAAAAFAAAGPAHMGMHADTTAGGVTLQLPTKQPSRPSTHSEVGQAAGRASTPPSNRGFMAASSGNAAFNRYERGLADGLQQDFKVLPAESVTASSRTPTPPTRSRSHTPPAGSRTPTPPDASSRTHSLQLQEPGGCEGVSRHAAATGMLCAERRRTSEQQQQQHGQAPAVDAADQHQLQLLHSVDAGMHQQQQQQLRDAQQLADLLLLQAQEQAQAQGQTHMQHTMGSSSSGSGGLWGTQRQLYKGPADLSGCCGELQLSGSSFKAPGSSLSNAAGAAGVAIDRAQGVLSETGQAGAVGDGSSFLKVSSFNSRCGTGGLGTDIAGSSQGMEAYTAAVAAYRAAGMADPAALGGVVLAADGSLLLTEQQGHGQQGGWQQQQGPGQSKVEGWYQRLQRARAQGSWRRHPWQSSYTPLPADAAASAVAQQLGGSSEGSHTEQTAANGLGDGSSSSKAPAGVWGRRATVKDAWLRVDGRVAAGLPWQALAAVTAVGHGHHAYAGLETGQPTNSDCCAASACLEGPSCADTCAASGQQAVRASERRLLAQLMWLKSAAGVIRGMGGDAAFLEQRLLQLLQQGTSAAGLELLLWSVDDERQQQQQQQQQLCGAGAAETSLGTQQQSAQGLAHGPAGQAVSGPQGYVWRQHSTPEALSQPLLQSGAAAAAATVGLSCKRPAASSCSGGYSWLTNDASDAKRLHGDHLPLLPAVRCAPLAAASRRTTQQQQQQQHQLPLPLPPQLLLVKQQQQTVTPRQQQRQQGQHQQQQEQRQVGQEWLNRRHISVDDFTPLRQPQQQQQQQRQWQQQQQQWQQLLPITTQESSSPVQQQQQFRHHKLPAEAPGPAICLLRPSQQQAMQVQQKALIRRATTDCRPVQSEGAAGCSLSLSSSPGCLSSAAARTNPVCVKQGVVSVSLPGSSSQNTAAAAGTAQCVQHVPQAQAHAAQQAACVAVPHALQPHAAVARQMGHTGFLAVTGEGTLAAPVLRQGNQQQQQRVQAQAQPLQWQQQLQPGACLPAAFAGPTTTQLPLSFVSTRPQRRRTTKTQPAGCEPAAAQAVGAQAPCGSVDGLLCGSQHAAAGSCSSSWWLQAQQQQQQQQPIHFASAVQLAAVEQHGLLPQLPDMPPQRHKQQPQQLWRGTADVQHTLTGAVPVVTASGRMSDPGATLLHGVALGPVVGNKAAAGGNSLACQHGRADSSSMSGGAVAGSGVHSAVSHVSVVQQQLPQLAVLRVAGV